MTQAAEFVVVQYEDVRLGRVRAFRGSFWPLLPGEDSLAVVGRRLYFLYPVQLESEAVARGRGWKPLTAAPYYG